MLARIKGKQPNIQNRSKLVQGTVGERISLEFSEEWSSLAVTAVFSAGTLTRDVIVCGEEITVPWELLAEANHTLCLGFHGVSPDGSTVLRTDIAELGKIHPSLSPSGNEAEAPSPSRADQIQALAEQALTAAQSVRDDADSGVFNGLAGNGIAYIAKTASSGLVDTYTVTYTDGSATAFTVTNGADSEIAASSLAGTFSTTVDYSAGDHVIYNGLLFRFIIDHPAGIWIGTDAHSVMLSSEVIELRSAVESLTEKQESSNVFDQANAVIVEGKYLNYTNGNEGTNAQYCYAADFIPVKASTKYYGTVWAKSDGSYLGPYNGFVLFYAADKSFIGGLSGTGNQNPFITPANCAYIRISFALSSWSTNNYMFEESEIAARMYVPYTRKKLIKLPFVTVDINGKGHYTRIADAVNGAPAGAVIYVMPGEYVENVKAWNKEIHIVGASREACVIKDTSGNYSTPPLEIGAGSLQNMSVIESACGAGTENAGAYAIHIESNHLYNKTLLIRNCYIFSDSSSAIGLGLRGGCCVRIEDCEIICAGARASTGAAPLYFHDADAQAYWGSADLYLRGSVLRNTSPSLFSMLTINSIHAENSTNMHLMYNIFVRSKTPSLSQKYNTWNSSGNTVADGWNGLSHMYLEDDSFGNNLSDLNYNG